MNTTATVLFAAKANEECQRRFQSVDSCIASAIERLDANRHQFDAAHQPTFDSARTALVTARTASPVEAREQLTIAMNTLRPLRDVQPGTTSSHRLGAIISLADDARGGLYPILEWMRNEEPRLRRQVEAQAKEEARLERNRPLTPEEQLEKERQEDISSKRRFMNRMGRKDAYSLPADQLPTWEALEESDPDAFYRAEDYFEHVEPVLRQQREDIEADLAWEREHGFDDEDFDTEDFDDETGE